MKTSDADILFVPGLGGAGPDHWQSRWAAKLSTAQLLAPAPGRHALVAAVLDAARACSKPIVLVGHSLGAHAIAHAAVDLPPGLVKGAMLVAPPSEAALRAIAAQTETAPDFLPIARAKLPFASLFVASRDDPYSPYEASEELAQAWGAKLLDAGMAGHIGAESGHGPWPEGLMSFAGFLRGI